MDGGLQTAPRGAWVKRSASAATPWARLFCFPHAGGGASSFNGWRKLLPAGIELAAIQLPGREDRQAETPVTDIGDLIAALLPHMEPLTGLPFLLYGHSLGAIVAFDLLREMRRHRLPMPCALLVSGRRAPQLPLSHKAHGLGPDEELADYLRLMGATPGEILDRPHWRDRLFPTIRADLNISDLYEYAGEPPFDCPIHCFAGRDDPLVSHEECRAWAAQTAAGFALTELSGGHFFAASEQAVIDGEAVSRLAVAGAGVAAP
jgi:medium-chain acyl-[acyl-carrier-protein] hydrolase